MDTSPIMGLEPVKEQLIKEQEAVEEQTNGDDDIDDISEVYFETVKENDSVLDGHDSDDDLVDDEEEEKRTGQCCGWRR